MKSLATIGFLGGIFACGHCLGMCGGFVLHLARERDGRMMLAEQLMWQSGRISMYIFLGALAGYAGSYLEQILYHSWIQQALTLATGGAIVFAGLSILGVLPLRGQPAGGGLLGRLVPSFFTTPTRGSALLLGFTTGILPCPVILGFLAYAFRSGSVVDGMTVMGGLGLGTLLPLLALGTAGRLAGLHARKWGTVAGGVLLVLLGAATMLRGTSFCHQLSACGVAYDSGTPDAKPCCPKKQP